MVLLDCGGGAGIPVMAGQGGIVRVLTCVAPPGIVIVVTIGGILKLTVGVNDEASD